MLLEQHSSFFQSASLESQYLVGGLILVHVCQMVSNAHAITELCLIDENNERQERIATAIYPSASLMNHNCDPTVINRFDIVIQFSFPAILTECSNAASLVVYKVIR